MLVQVSEYTPVPPCEALPMPGENFGAVSWSPWTVLTTANEGGPDPGTVSDAFHWQ